LQAKTEEISRLKIDVSRQKDVIQTLKSEKVDSMRAMSMLDSHKEATQKAQDELHRLKDELKRKDSHLQNFRVLNEELKTERELRNEQLSKTEERLKSFKSDLDRKDKVIWEWKGKFDNLIERQQLELAEGEGAVKERERLNEKCKKLKHELDRKEAQVESFKSKLLKMEEGQSQFDKEIKDKQQSLSKELQELNKRSEAQLQALRTAELNATSLRSAILTLFRSLRDKAEQLDTGKILQPLGMSSNSLNQSHGEAMKLLELSEEELNLFIHANDSGPHPEELSLVKLLEKSDIDVDQVTRALVDRINRHIDLEIEANLRKTSAD